MASKRGKKQISSAFASLGIDRPKKLQASTSSNHKVRSRWFQGRAAWPFREAPVGTLIRERTRARAALGAVPATEVWHPVGPSNIGGRMTSLVVHPEDADRIWAGAAGGGVWRSTDGGQHWEPLWHGQPTLNVGSLAMDPQNPEILYCGTGEANLSADSYAGIGVFRSTNGGDTWLLLAPAETAGLPTRIGALAIDPEDSMHLRLGGLGFSSTVPSGMFVSRDGGVTWAREGFVADGRYWCHDIAFDPRDSRVLYTSVTAQGAGSGLWKSENGGRTWRQLTEGLPFGASIGRASLAIAPANSKVIYTLLAAAADPMGAALGIYKSKDAGESWEEVGGGALDEERQISYNNTIAVHPRRYNHVICGGVDLHLTTDGGRTWRQVTRWNQERGEPDYAHADHHKVVFPAADPGRVYAMNDGGMDVSPDGGETWENRSNGLAVTMFYDLDVSQVDPGLFGGGAQDNGTLLTANGGAADFFEITGGDGGWMVLDTNDPGHLVASVYNFNIFRFRSTSGWANISPPAEPEEQASIWMCFIVLDPADSNVIVTGTSRVWRSPDDGASWSPISPFLDGSSITALEISRASSQRIYAGTENGGFFRSIDGGATWSPNLQDRLPGFTITRIASKPDDPEVVVCTVANFGHSHVFCSNDGGLTWRDIDRRRLPDVPHHVVLIPSQSPDRIYVGNDAGVFVSPDLGSSWFDLSSNLPSSMVVDLVLQEEQNTLTAATYGRSLWRLRLPPSLASGGGIAIS